MQDSGLFVAMLERGSAAKVCYKLSENNIGVAGKIVTLPYYMAMFLE